MSRRRFLPLYCSVGCEELVLTVGLVASVLDGAQWGRFQPEKRSQRLPRGLGWETTPAKTTDTAGHLGAPLVTATTGPVFPALRLTLVEPRTGGGVVE